MLDMSALLRSLHVDQMVSLKVEVHWLILSSTTWLVDRYSDNMMDS